MRISEVRPVVVETIPERNLMENGVIYFSLKFMTAIHLCACGCGDESVTPLRGPHAWEYNFNQEANILTLRPSILNRICPNKAHYFIEQNKVRWA